MVCITGLCPFEAMIGNGAGLLVGNPFILGLMFAAIFGAVIFIMGGRLDFKVMVAVPILILTLLFIPMLWLPLGIAFSVIAFLAIMRLITK